MSLSISSIHVTHLWYIQDVKQISLQRKNGKNRRWIWVFPKIRVPQNGWFMIHDLAVPLFLETPISVQPCEYVPRTS